MVIHKKIAFSVVSLACGLVMWQAMKNTCPPKDEHMRAVTDIVENVVDRIFEQRIKVPEESRQLAEYLSIQVIPQAVERLTSQRIDFTDYGIFSLGNITNAQGESVPVSIGLFGKVFTTVDEEEVYKHIDAIINELDVDTIVKSINKNNKHYGSKNCETTEDE